VTVREIQTFSDGQDTHLVKKAVRGKYTMLVGAESIDVYVLREILDGT